MPEVRSYIVSETREVKVSANSTVDAAIIAKAAFEYGQNSDNGVAKDKGPVSVWGNTTSRVRVVETHSIEEL